MKDIDTCRRNDPREEVRHNIINQALAAMK